jgi:hypothetical protein
MKDKGKELAARLTGFSTPLFGVSWNPPVVERDVAQELLSELEDRRVLYNPYEAETPEYCIQSVLEIRRLLRELMRKLQGSGVLAGHLRGMAAAARAFLDRMEEFHRVPGELRSLGYGQSMAFNDALGQMRGVFGVHIAFLASRYDVPIRGHLGRILPSLPDENDFDG